MERGYLAEIIRRSDLGRCRDVALGLWGLAGYQVGVLVQLPVWSADPKAITVASLLACSNRQAERLVSDAIKYGLLERIGKQALRLSHPARWRRNKMNVSGVSQRNTPSQNSGDAPSQQDGPLRRNTAEELRHDTAENSVATQRTPPSQDSGPSARHRTAVSARHGTAVSAASGGFPDPPLKEEAFKDVEDLKEKDRPPQTAKDSSRLPDAPDLSSQSTSGTDNDLQKWSRPFARQVCERLKFEPSNADPLAAEFRRLAKTHYAFDEDPAQAKTSVEGLIDQLAGEADLRDGGQLTGALRNRWAEWTSGGGGKERERWTGAGQYDKALAPEESKQLVDNIRQKHPFLRQHAENENEDQEDKLVHVDEAFSDYGATSEPVSVAECLNLAGIAARGGTAGGEDVGASGSPSEGQKPRARGPRRGSLTEAEANALLGLLEMARAAPSDAPAAENAVRVAAGRIAVSIWREPGGREGIFMQCRGTKPPTLSRLRGWAAAAWPGLAAEAVEYVTDGNARAAKTKEAVEL